MKKSIVTPFAILIILFLLFALGTWEINPARWSEFMRYAFSTALFVLLAQYLDKK